MHDLCSKESGLQIERDNPLILTPKRAGDRSTIVVRLLGFCTCFHSVSNEVEGTTGVVLAAQLRWSYESERE